MCPGHVLVRSPYPVLARCAFRIRRGPKEPRPSSRSNRSEPKAHHYRQREAARPMALESSRQQADASTQELDRPCIRGPSNWRRISWRRRVPRITGLPARTSGSTTMRSESGITTVYRVSARFRDSGDAPQEINDSAQEIPDAVRPDWGATASGPLTFTFWLALADTATSE